MNTKLLVLFSVFLLLLSSCIFQKIGTSQTPSQTQAPATTPAAPSASQSQPSQAQTQGADVIVNCSKKAVVGANAVLVYYANGQKETFTDYCPNKDQDAFKIFLVHYSCSVNNSVRQVIMKCTNNMTCSSGICS